MIPELEIGSVLDDHIIELYSLTTQRRLYNHLDWWQLDDWVSSDAFVYAAQGNVLSGALLIIPVSYQDSSRIGSATSLSSWLRWCALGNGTAGSQVMNRLLRFAEMQCREASIRDIYSLVEPGHWINHYLKENAFSAFDEVVTLVRRENNIKQISSGLNSTVNIRKASQADYLSIVDVDHSAFDEHWHFPKSVLLNAMNTSTYFSVAELDDITVGYQMTSGNSVEAHITRLAVHPSQQGKGVGSALLDDTITYMKLRYGTEQITLNTQASNIRSQRLYQKRGFSVLSPRVKVLHKSVSAY